MEASEQPETFKLVIRSEGKQLTPSLTRLKRLLKTLVRSYGFRCVSVTPSDSQGQHGDEGEKQRFSGKGVIDPLPTGNNP